MTIANQMVFIGVGGLFAAAVVFVLGVHEWAAACFVSANLWLVGSIIVEKIKP